MRSCRLDQVRITIGIMAALLVGACGEASPDEEATAPPEPPAPASEPTAPASASMQQRWWSWAATEGFETNPVADLTGDFCDRNQPDDVWFLAGTFGETAERVCTVPADVPIVVPVVNLFSDSRAECDAFMAEAAGTAELDGEPLAVDPIANEEVTIEAAADNAVTGAAGQFPVVACGLWVQIDPPTTGTHELQIRGEAAAFAVSVDYTLEVVE